MAHVGLLLIIGSLGLVFMAHRIGVTSASVLSLVLVVQRGLPMLDRPCPCSTSPIFHDVKHRTTCLCSTESLYYYNLSIANASHPTLSQAHVLRPFGFALLKFANGLQPVTMARLEPKFLMRNLRGRPGRRTLVNLALKHSLQASILLLLYQWCSQPESRRSYSREPEVSSSSFTVCVSTT
ncbi:hypothetical protein VNO77_03277 [Canavalia gladiata]|uniref:Secreted protein n=1 Tax=Canavalia gladiata TaxID=3824 RepID=A0AAN9MUK5_CANGL